MKDNIWRENANIWRQSFAECPESLPESPRSAYKLEVHISKLFYEISLAEMQGKKDSKSLADAGFIKS